MLENAVDGTTTALKVIEHAHHEVHSGSSFSTGAYDLDLDDGETLTVAFTTNSGAKWLHMVGILKSSSAGLAEILEGPTITADSGTEQLVINRNRNKTGNTSGALSIETSPVANTVSINPTITADGDVIFAEGIGVGKEKGASEARALSEIVLAADTTYAFRITGSADNGNASVRLVWYEHTDTV